MMDIGKRACSIKNWKVPEVEKKVEQIFNVVQGIEIDKAIFLLEWCSRKLLEQKCVINPDFLQDVLQENHE